MCVHDIGIMIIFQQSVISVQNVQFLCSLLATTKTEHQVKGGLLLDVVVRQGTAILELLASKDQPLLVWGDAFLVLDLGLDILYGV